VYAFEVVDSLVKKLLGGQKGSMADTDTTIIERVPSLAQRFRVLGTLGEGAGSAVYLVADQQDKGKQYALKVLVNDQAFDEHTLERFKEEMRVCSSLSHENLVQAYDFIDLGDKFAFTMEYVKGEDLRKIFKKPDTNYDEIDWILEQLLNALGELHSNEIVHRDLKLENILIREDGVLKLSDLGLMKRLGAEGLTRAGVLLGTVQYMPPEYIQSGYYDHRGDIYAVGNILLELLTKKRRLGKMTGQEAMTHLIDNEFEIPELLFHGLPKKYVSILRRALERDMESRYQSVEEILTDLKRGQGDFAEGAQADVKAGLSLSKMTGGGYSKPKNEVSGSRDIFILVRRIALIFLLLTAIAWMLSRF